MKYHYFVYFSLPKQEGSLDEHNNEVIIDSPINHFEAINQIQRMLAEMYKVDYVILRNYQLLRTEEEV